MTGGDPGQVESRIDAEFQKDMAQMAAHGVRRQEAATAGCSGVDYQPATASSESVKAAQPLSGRRAGTATAHAHGPQSPPHPAGIPASPSLGIQHQGAAERIYAALCSAVIHDNATQILQRRGKCDSSGALLVELHRLSKVFLAVTDSSGRLPAPRQLPGTRHRG